MNRLMRFVAVYAWAGWMLIGLLSPASAQDRGSVDAPVAAPSSTSARPSNDFRPILFMFAVIGVIFYMVVLRPQRREQRDRDEMLSDISKGDHVVTAGGIHGTVEAIDVSKGIVSVQIAPKTVIRVNKASMSNVTPRRAAVA